MMNFNEVLKHRDAMVDMNLVNQYKREAQEKADAFAAKLAEANVGAPSESFTHLLNIPADQLVDEMIASLA
jgi:hypothetical protein